MRVLVTGANGFIGRRLVARLLAAGALASKPVTELVLCDVRFAKPPMQPTVRLVTGSIADPNVLHQAFEKPLDCVFHLACIAGGLAEENFDLGRQVNLDAMLLLLEALRKQSEPPRLIFSSSIGVFGALPNEVDDNTCAKPTWSYGTHKLIGELLVSDYTRKNFVDGRTLRFPGIVARPPDPSGALSAFMSDLIRELAAGRPFVCPVSPAATAWWMSAECCIDNVLWAAQVPREKLDSDRVWMLPPLRCAVQEIVSAVGTVFKVDTEKLIRYQPDPLIEERFGRLPPVHLSGSEALGFHHDGSPEQLVRCALS